MIRVLALTESLDPSSGWGSYSRELVTALRAQDVQVEVISTEKTIVTGLRLPNVHASPPTWLSTFAHLALTRNKLKAFDIVHAFLEPYAKLLRSIPLPSVITTHGSFVDPNAHGPRWARLAFQDALDRSEAIVTVSQFTRDRLPASFQHKAHVIHNGVNLAIQDEVFLLPVSPRGKDGPLILSVGALKPRKGFDQLMRGFARLLQTHPMAQLAIVGDDSDRPTREQLQALAQTLGITKSVHIPGKVSRAELLGWYRACDVFALTPRSDGGGFEGFGIVYLEAGVFGKPCVGSLNSGAVEAIESGITGILVDPHDPVSVAQGLEQALKLDPIRIQDRMKEKTWDRRAQEYKKVYLDIAAKKADHWR